MIVNANHGAGKTSAQTAGAVTIKFSDSISKIERLYRYTGKFEMMHLCDHTLNQYPLPGCTGDLFRFHVSGR